MNMNIEYSVSTDDDGIGISTVIQEMQKQIDAENINDKSHEFDNSVNCLHQYRQKGMPLAVNNARGHMFLRAMKSEGKEYQVVDTAWGQFAFIPVEDIDIFENQRSLYMSVVRTYRLFNVIFRYWLFYVYDGNV